MENILICERNIVVQTSQERVWRLIGKVIFSSLPGMENLEIVDENRFRALMRNKVFGVTVTMKTQGEIADLEPPKHFSTKLLLEGPGGLLKMALKVSFTMSAINGEKTGMACKAVIERIGLLPGIFVLGEARRFARATFEAIEKRMREVA